jgi:phage shock protein PspC (stress-responsive transcriptional regulator)
VNPSTLKTPKDMNKTIIINISGIVFHIEEDAYEILKQYMFEVKSHFGHSEDSEEIVQDIESRIAEMFSERLQLAKKEVITLLEVEEVINQMGRPSDFDQTQESENDTYQIPPFDRYQAPRKLMRDTEHNYIAGVCSGISLYLKVDVRIIRILFILLTFMGGVGFILYALLWILLAPAHNRLDRMVMRGEMPNLQNIKKNFETEMDQMGVQVKKTSSWLKSGALRLENFIRKAARFFIKTIAFLALIGLIGGGIVLLIAFISGFDLLGSDSKLAIFHINIIEKDIRSELFIAGLIAIIIPILWMISLCLQLLLNKSLISKFSGLGMLLIWIASICFVGYFAVRTSTDFAETSTIIQERKVEKAPIYKLTLRDLNVILLNDSTSEEEKYTQIQNQSQYQNKVIPEYNQRVRIYIEPIDSLAQPFAIMTFKANGENFEVASQRAGQIDYRFTQQNGEIQFESHFTLSHEALDRKQRAATTLKLPVGSIVWVHRDLSRYIEYFDFNTCRNNTKLVKGNDFEYSEWIMTSSGMKCLAPNPPAEEPDSEDESVE